MGTAIYIAISQFFTLCCVANWGQWSP